MEGSNDKDISVVFGDYIEVAKNFSKGQNWDTERAGWGIRFLAWIIDLLIYISTTILLFFSGALVILNLFFSMEEKNQIIDELLAGKTVNLGEIKQIEGFLSIEGIIILISGFILISTVIVYTFAYFIILEGLYSATIGKKLFNLKVVDKSGIKITWQQAILRNLTKPSISSQFFLFDVLIGVFLERQDPLKVEKQRGMDVLAGTLVVKQN